MQIDDLISEPLKENISINLTQSDKVRWENIKKELKKINKDAKLNGRARDKIREVMDEAEKTIAEYRKKNIVF